MRSERGKSSPTGLVALPGTGLGEDEIEIGFISGVFGVAGEVRLFLHNTESTLLDAGCDVVLLDAQGRRFAARMSSRDGAGKRVIGRIEGLEVREDAAVLKDWKLAVAASALPAPAPDEFYVWELEGMTVYVGDRKVGVVDTVHATPGGDVIEVSTALGPLFVASVQRYVASIDLEAGRIQITPEALDEP
jgi:16S rRNA processing protein RimM